MFGPVRRATLVLCIALALAVAFGVLDTPAVIRDEFDRAWAALSANGDPAVVMAAALRGVELGWHRTPAILIAISSMLTMPLMAYAVSGLRRAHRRRDENRERAKAPHFSDALRSPMTHAWIEFGGGQGRRLELAREIVRIGRGSDNDVRLPGSGIDTVQALIRRTPEAEYVVMDMSGGNGPGLAVNGQRRASERLRDGDTISLGEYAMTFHRTPMRDVTMPPQLAGSPVGLANPGFASRWS